MERLPPHLSALGPLAAIKIATEQGRGRVDTGRSFCRRGNRMSATLFYHAVGEGEDGLGDSHPKRFGAIEVDHEL